MDSEFENAGIASLPYQELEKAGITALTFQQLREMTNDFSDDMLVGRGTFAVVYKVS